MEFWYRAYSLPDRTFAVNVTFAVEGTPQSPQPVETDSPTGNNEQTDESKPLPAQIDEGLGAPAETPTDENTMERPNAESNPETNVPSEDQVDAWFETEISLPACSNLIKNYCIKFKSLLTLLDL